VAGLNLSVVASSLLFFCFLGGAREPDFAFSAVLNPVRLSSPRWRPSSSSPPRTSSGSASPTSNRSFFSLFFLSWSVLTRVFKLATVGSENEAEGRAEEVGKFTCCSFFGARTLTRRSTTSGMGAGSPFFCFLRAKIAALFPCGPNHMVLLTLICVPPLR
jgi:hypothetical protein